MNLLNSALTASYDKINSLTKYPSILTYHELGKKGKLQNEMIVPVTEENMNDSIYATEKIDGTNCRIITFGDDYAIGLREEIIYAKGDRIINNQMGVVKQLIPIAEKIIATPFSQLRVFYGEVYGGKIGANKKNYTTSGRLGFRLFDTWVMYESEVKEILNKKTKAEIAAWRDNGGQPFLSVKSLQNLCSFEGIQCVPYIKVTKRSQLPTDIAGMYNYLKDDFEFTNVGLDATGDSEGVVFRNEARTFIAKARFEDYERTLGIIKK